MGEPTQKHIYSLAFIPGVTSEKNIWEHSISGQEPWSLTICAAVFFKIAGRVSLVMFFMTGSNPMYWKVEESLKYRMHWI